MQGPVLDQLNSLDPGGTATLADWDPTADPVPQSGGLPGAAAVRSYKPNEVVIELDAQTAGVLVLTDPWYPGWVCRIDGRETKIWKADYAFRGVMVPDGSRQVVFRFEPQSYRRGKWVSVITVVLVFLFGIGLIGRAAMRPRFVISQPIGARPNVA
jgi:Bacterial membrane protein YfhO